MCALITTRCFTIKHTSVCWALWKFVTKASIAFEANKSFVEWALPLINVKSDGI